MDYRALLAHIAGNGSKVTLAFVKRCGPEFGPGDVATLAVKAPANGFATVVFPSGRMVALGVLIGRGFATVRGL